MNITRIYLIENCYGDPNKVYIGKEKSHQKIGRDKAHKCTYGKQILFSYIDEVYTWKKEYWKPLECFWIEQFRQWGFEIMNKNEGGGGPSFHTNETKYKLSKALSGKTRTEETIKKLKISLKGIKHNSEKMKGLKRSEDTKHKMSIAKIGTKLSSETKHKMSKARLGKKFPNISKAKIGIKQPDSFYLKKNKPINQYSKNGEFIKTFKSITEAAKSLGFEKDNGGISCVLNGKQKTAYGYIWQYYI